MIAEIEGVIKQVNKIEKTDKSGHFFKVLVEQPNPSGPTEKVYMDTVIDGRKVGEKVRVKVRVSLTKPTEEGERWLKIWEVT